MFSSLWTSKKSASEVDSPESRQLTTLDEVGEAARGNFFRLEHLPSEVLASINLHVSGISLLRLLSCGSKLLYHKLTKLEAATQFSVVNGVDYDLQYSDWRNRNFHSIRLFEGLRSLEIVGFAKKSLRYFSTEKLEDLPSTLESLRFEFIEALNLWVDLKHVKFNHETPANVPNPQVYHIDAKFPNLRVLELFSTYWDRFSLHHGPTNTYCFIWTPEMKSEFLAHLPTCLERASFLLDSVPGDCTKGLPQDLHTLRFRTTAFCSDASRFGETLPIHLKDLTLDATIDFHLLGSLPPSLERFTQEKSLVAPALNRTLAPAPCRFVFPPTLLYLCVLHTILRWDKSTLLALPRQLIHFEVTSTAQVTDDLIEHLPPLLQVIRFGNYSGRTKLTPLMLDYLIDRPVRILQTTSEVAWPWSSFERLPATIEHFRQDVLTYADIPGKPNSSSDEAFAYWSSKLPKGAIVRSARWDNSKSGNGGFGQLARDVLQSLWK